MHTKIPNTSEYVPTLLAKDFSGVYSGVYFGMFSC